ncbi:MAG: PAS domain-containing protein [Bryobacteraceae bacterium]|nr:PAS domain-containing protein [Bryobacteraceae bacterium]
MIRKDRAAAGGDAIDEPIPTANRAASSSDPFSGGGRMGELMRSIDWSRTPVGPVESWPQSLKTALSVLLKQRTAVFIFWGPEHVQFYNDAYRPILGTSKHPAAMGQRGRECWPEIWDVIEPMLEAVHRGESTAVEDGLLVMDRHGYLEEGYYTYTYSPITDESGAVGGVFCIVYDTTDRVIGERRLRTLRDLASRAIARDAETACGIAAGTLAANPYDVPFAAIYLHDADFKHARLVGAAGIEPDSPAAPRVIHLEGGHSALSELASKNQAEELKGFASQAGPLPGGPWPVGAESAILLPIALPGQARPAGFIVAGISPRKRLDAAYRTFFELLSGQIATAVAESRAYEQERKRAEALAELDRAKTAFFSNVSHEFRTPLTLMLGPVADLLRQPELTEGQRQELALVHRNALRLLKLVNTLLDFSRIEAGRMQACYEPTDISAITTDLASVFRSAIEKAGLKLSVQCPPLDEPVYLDCEMWEKVVLNLLSNALKYTFGGEIEVAVEKRAGAAELRVRDTGIGIDEADLAQVFDRFHRVEGARGRSQEGSGIGLALVQELVKLHGGAVRADSELGAGSVFTVSIPLGSSHLPADRIGKPRQQTSTSVGAQPYVEEALRWLPDAPVTAAELPAEHEDSDALLAAPATGERARILLADDNADMRDYLRRLLGNAYKITAVSDGLRALDSIRNSPPDLVLADVMMPGLDGFALLKAIRGHPETATLPVLLLSARAGEESRVEGLQAGADDYLVKPFSARDLLARVSSRLEIARLRQQTARLEHRLRKEAESERQRLRDLVAQAPAVIAVLRGPDHTFELANWKYLEATGRAENELIGRPIREALPELADQAFPALLDEVYATSRPFVGTEMHARLDRRRGRGLEDRYFNFVYQPTRDAAGAVDGILVHAVDVTDQVVARRRVEENERQLHTLADSIPQLAWMAEPDGYIFWYNQRWYEYTGATPDQMAGWGWQTVHHPEHLPAVLERWRESLRTGAAFEMEFPLRGSQGEFRWFLTRITPLRAADGAIMRWFGTNTDITELKRIRDERTQWLHREQDARRTAELLNKVGPTLLSELDPRKLVQSIIDLATSLTAAEIGIFLHSVVDERGDRHVLHAVSHEWSDRMEGSPQTDDVRRMHRIFADQATILRDDASAEGLRERWPFGGLLEAAGVRSLLAAPITSRSGQTLGALLFGRSVPASFTSRHEALIAGIAAQAAIALDNAYLFDRAQRIQAELERSNEDLRRANKDLETFAYSASHDLQEPLRNIAICAQLLQRNRELASLERAPGLVSGIIEGATRMEALVRDLLAYTKITQSCEPEAAPVDANHVLAQVLDSLKAAIAENNARVTRDELPVIEIHSAHLSLLLQNLVGNALKYRREDAPRVHISAARSDGCWTLSVADNGIGIEPEYRQQVFGLFKRLHGGNKYSGSGVGLAICQRIVEQYGGRIWVDDAPDGLGSVFSFTIPERSQIEPYANWQASFRRREDLKSDSAQAD